MGGPRERPYTSITGPRQQILGTSPRMTTGEGVEYEICRKQAPGIFLLANAYSLFAQPAELICRATTSWFSHSTGADGFATSPKISAPVASTTSTLR